MFCFAPRVKNLEKDLQNLRELSHLTYLQVMENYPHNNETRYLLIDSPVQVGGCGGYEIVPSPARQQIWTASRDWRSRERR